MKVPSLCGITVNETADHAARNWIGVDHTATVKVSLTDYQAAITYDLKRLWHEYLNITNTQKGK